MLKKFEKSILNEVLSIIDNIDCLKSTNIWNKKGSAYSISIFKDKKKFLYAYLGIRFIKGRNYIIPYLRISSKDMKFADECNNDVQIIVGSEIESIDWKSCGLTLYKTDFNDYANTSVEILNPTKDIIEVLLNSEEGFNEANAKTYGITKSEMSVEMIRSWDLFEEFFFLDSVSYKEVYSIIKPVLDDIDRIVNEYYLPFVMKLASSNK